jgi:ligand-binding SRPBCC domain-containing protein
MQTIERDMILSVDRETLWGFVAAPKNLNGITPPELHFRIMSDVPDSIFDGLMIDYEISLPFIGRRKWVTEIKHIHEGVSFVDEQRYGPYGFWYHFHELVDAGQGVTRMRDEVHYRVPFGVLGSVVAGAQVKARVESIFDYRARKMIEIFGGG